MERWYVPADHEPQKGPEEAGVCGLQVRGDNTGMETVGRNALAVQTVM